MAGNDASQRDLEVAAYPALDNPDVLIERAKRDVLALTGDIRDMDPREAWGRLNLWLQEDPHRLLAVAWLGAAMVDTDRSVGEMLAWTRMDHDARNHGYTAYTRGCRCAVCLEAKSEYMRRRRARGHALAKTVGDATSYHFVPDITHGRSGYEERGCRCPTCVSAHSASRMRCPSAQPEARHA